MDGAHGERAKSWAALPVLEQLSQPSATLTSEDVAKLLETRINGIASTLRPSKEQLENAGVRFEEVVTRHRRRGRSIWSAGPRIAQARHLLRLTRQGDPDNGWGDHVALEDIPPDDPRPALVVRTLARRGRGVAFDSLAELESTTDHPGLVLGADTNAFVFPGEVFIERIEPGADGRKIAIPAGYEENGTWVRGTFDEHSVHVGGSEGAGVGLVRDGAWFERRLGLVDARRQVDELHARALAMRETMELWNRVDETTGLRHVQWVLLEPYKGPCSAPPLHLRIRCWREVVIEPVGRAPVRMLEEGFAGTTSAPRSVRSPGGARRRHQGRACPSRCARCRWRRSSRRRCRCGEAVQPVELRDTCLRATGQAQCRGTLEGICALEAQIRERKERDVPNGRETWAEEKRIESEARR